MSESIKKQLEKEFEDMDDNEIIKAGYCPTCYSKLIREGGCTHCPNGHVDLCG